VEAALIALAGAIIGILLNELLRRRKRAETLLEKTFTARLDAYAGLASVLGKKYGEVLGLLYDPEKGPQDVRKVADDGIYEIAKYCDLNVLYLDDSVCESCVDALKPAAAVVDSDKPALTDDGRKILRDRIAKRYGDALLSVKDHAGVTEMENAMRSIAKPRRRASS
jgi:hypothetical protein